MLMDCTVHVFMCEATRVDSEHRWVIQDLLSSLFNSLKIQLYMN